MSDEFNDDDLDELTEEQDDDSSTVKMLRAQLRKAKAEAKAGKEWTEKGQAALRKLALMEAGIDIAKPQGKLFAKAYDGELDTDAIKAAAIEYGVIEEQSEAEEDGPALQRMSEVAAGASPSGAQDERSRILSELDPNQLSEEEFWAKAESLGVAR